MAIKVGSSPLSSPHPTPIIQAPSANIEALPVEVIGLIFSYLTLRELVSSGGVSKYWNSLTDNENLEAWEVFKKTLYPDGLPLLSPYDPSKSPRKNLQNCIENPLLGSESALLKREWSQALKNTLLFKLPLLKYQEIHDFSSKNPLFNLSRPTRTLTACQILTVIIPKTSDKYESRIVLEFDLESQKKHPRLTTYIFKKEISTHEITPEEYCITTCKIGTLAQFIEQMLKHYGIP